MDSSGTINHTSVELWQRLMDLGLGATWASLHEITPNDTLVKSVARVTLLSSTIRVHETKTPERIPPCPIVPGADVLRTLQHEFRYTFHEFFEVDVPRPVCVDLGEDRIYL